MATTTFTTRIDTDLKSRLEKLAKREDRSASYMANRAIQNMVEERDATIELVKTGLELVDRGISISEKAVDAWMRSPEGTPFPKADTFE